MLYLVIVGAGFGEETLFRGYLFERLRKLLRPERAWPPRQSCCSRPRFSVLSTIPSKDSPASSKPLSSGSCSGRSYAWNGQLFLLMIAHAAFDLTAVAIIYWDLEHHVAQLVFK